MTQFLGLCLDAFNFPHQLSFRGLCEGLSYKPKWPKWPHCSFPDQEGWGGRGASYLCKLLFPYHMAQVRANPEKMRKQHLSMIWSSCGRGVWRKILTVAIQKSHTPTRELPPVFMGAHEMRTGLAGHASSWIRKQESFRKLNHCGLHLKQYDF